MGWLPVATGIIATLIFWKSGHIILTVLSILSVIGGFWSWGIMHNYATEQAKKRKSYSGDFYDFTREEVEAVPDWITQINMVISVFSFILLIIAIVVVLF